MSEARSIVPRDRRNQALGARTRVKVSIALGVAAAVGVTGCALKVFENEPAPSGWERDVPDAAGSLADGSSPRLDAGSASGRSDASLAPRDAGASGADSSVPGATPATDAGADADAGAPDPGTTYVPTGYHLVFDDEFSASAVDTGKWNTLAPWGVQFYSDSHQQQAFVPSGVILASGVAALTADRSSGNTSGQPYSSGSLTTNRTFTYGYFEARVSAPAGKGLWPAFWLTSSTEWPPEWDIFELVDGVCYGYQHPIAGGRCTFVDGVAGSSSSYVVPQQYGVYHVYGFLWTASDLYWYVDGVRTEHYAVDADAGANDAFWLNVSLQVGGDWPGNPDGTTVFPARLNVDYVRVYQP